MIYQLSITAPQLNGRSYPSTQAPIITKLSQGQIVPTLYEHNQHPFSKLESWSCIIAPPAVRCWVASYWTTPFHRFTGRTWPTDYRTITQRYGARKEYYSKFGLDGHEGTDFRAPTGTPIYSIDFGRVKSIHTNPKPKSQGGHNYGLHIRIFHSDGYESIFAHLDTIYVAPGDLIRPGQMIGRAGNTGNSFGAHLHLTLKYYGRFTNPEPFLKNVPLARDLP